LNETTLKELLEAGVHFGHQKRKWNPKTRKFIFGERKGICIINLEKTVEALKKAAAFLSDLSANGGQVLFVGTKHQAQEIVAAEAERCGMHYVNSRWLGGTLTNFPTLYSRIKKLRELENMTEESVSHLTKKEKLVQERLKQKLKKNLDGMKNLDKIPDVMVLVDANKGKIPIAEAKKTGMPVVATVDTNANPDPIDFCIPANDDAIKAISLIISRLADAVIEGKNRAVQAFEEKAAKEKAEKEKVEKEKADKAAEEADKAEDKDEMKKEEKITAEPDGAEKDENSDGKD
jgi:small subunit ribosomal protein S2